MDISPSIANSGFALPAQTIKPISVNQSERQDNPPSRPEGRSDSDNDIGNIDNDAIVRLGESVQADRLQRVDSLSAAPLPVQQALNSYQQTLDATRNYEQGELVGIDLFV